MVALVLQVAGSVLVSVGCGLWSLPAGLISAGVFALAFGVASSRAGE